MSMEYLSCDMTHCIVRLFPKNWILTLYGMRVLRGLYPHTTEMRTVSNFQSGKSVVCSPNGAKEIFKQLIKGLKS